MDVDTKRPEGGGLAGRLNADTIGQGGEGSKIGKILRTSFMDGPLAASGIEHSHCSQVSHRTYNFNLGIRISIRCALH